MTTHTFDCFRSGSTGELTVICTGMTAAPVVIDLETGASVTMHPAQAHIELASRIARLRASWAAGGFRMSGNVRPETARVPFASYLAAGLRLKMSDAAQKCRLS